MRVEAEGRGGVLGRGQRAPFHQLGVSVFTVLATGKGVS